VRSSQPKNKKEIEDIVYSIIEGKRKGGQLDESNLTLNDLKTIQDIFVEMLQAVFHPRINYAAAVAGATKTPAAPKSGTFTPPAVPKVTTEVRRTATEENRVVNGSDGDKKSEKPAPAVSESVAVSPKSTGTQPAVAPVNLDSEDDEAPLPDVPPLPRANAGSNDRVKNGTVTSENGKQQENKEQSADKDQPVESRDKKEK
jgi:hypothetical protein